MLQFQTPDAGAVLQVFTLIAMEPPIRVSGSGSADYVRDAKVRSFHGYGVSMVMRIL